MQFFCEVSARPAQVDHFQLHVSDVYPLAHELVQLDALGYNVSPEVCVWNVKSVFLIVLVYAFTLDYGEVTERIIEVSGMSVTYYTFTGNQLDAIHFHNLCVIVFRNSKFDYHTRNYCTATMRVKFHDKLSTHIS